MRVDDLFRIRLKAIAYFLIAASIGFAAAIAEAQVASVPVSDIGGPTLEQLLSKLEVQLRAVQDLQAREKAQGESRKLALDSLQGRIQLLQNEFDTGRRADELETSAAAGRIRAATDVTVALQAQVQQERQRLAAAAAERARLAEQAEKLRQEQEARRQAEAAKPVIPPGTEKRVALVMGNARYADRPLRNPINDSALMARTLQALGFDVQVANDVDRRGMLTALRDFENRARGADVALFYFAGHGAQLGGANYLIPVNSGIRMENDVPEEAIDAALVLRRIEDTRVKVELVVLDACRDNPFPGASRSGARGLARMSVPTSTIVAYATAPGSTADDGAGDNGTYTAALVKYLATPGLDVKEIFDRTAQEVERVTNGKQRPREDIGLRGRFALLAAPNSTSVAVGVAADAPQSTAAPAQAAVAADDPERELWELAKRRDNVTSYQAYLQTYPQGRFALVARAALQSIEAPQAPIVASPAQTMASALSSTAQRVEKPSSPPQPQRAAGEVFRDCPKCPEVVVIPAGRFLMGSPSWESKRDSDEGPQRWVNLKSFAIGKFEVTQAEWQDLMGSNPSNFKACDRTWFGAVVGTSENCPIENITWSDAQEFVKRLGARTGQRYRLPTEAEWEYAARAGTSTVYPWGDQIETGKANCDGCGSRWDTKSTAPVGRFAANAFGLFDMHGNVWEFVEDAWHDDYTNAPTDGSAWTEGGNPSRRVIRGGSWYYPPQNLRSAERIWDAPEGRDYGTGLRVVREF